MNKLSAVIICTNEENNIEECLQSITWADDIVIIDGGSNDNTIDIAKKFTDKVFINEWPGFAIQRNFSLTKVSFDWVFSLDADERCSEALKTEIQEIMSKDSINFNGFRIPRKSFFLNKWIKHCGWYPGYQLRLFRKDHAKVTDRLVHEGIDVNGEVGVLKNDILHFTMKSVKDFMTRINNYSTLAAKEKVNKKKVTLPDLIIRPPLSFLREFIFKKGFLDGVHGAMVALFNSITNMLTYMKTWELQNKNESEMKN
jgi:glycosyltransferase involved in cell wall biosynthesis